MSSISTHSSGYMPPRMVTPVSRLSAGLFLKDGRVVSSGSTGPAIVSAFVTVESELNVTHAAAGVSLIVPSVPSSIVTVYCPGKSECWKNTLPPFLTVSEPVPLGFCTPVFIPFTMPKQGIAAFATVA